MTAPLPTTPASLPQPASLPLPTGLPLAARLPLLGLYPAKYRATHGEEIVAVFAEATENVGPGTALREWAALAAHALRLRTRLSSRDPAGRIAAGAAPFVLAGAAGLSMVHLLIELFLPDPFEGLGLGWNPALRTALVAAQAGPWILALICAAVGRWTPARLLALLGVLGWVGPVLAFVPRDVSGYVPAYLLLLPFGIAPGMLLLLAPPDAVDLSPRGRRETVLAALALAVPMGAIATIWTWPERRYATYSPIEKNLLDATTAWPIAVLSLALLIHLGARRPDRLRAAGIALAVLPWTPMVFPPYYRMFTPPDVGVVLLTSHDLLRNTGIVLAFLGTATLLPTLRRTLGRSRPTDPPEPT